MPCSGCQGEGKRAFENTILTGRFSTEFEKNLAPFIGGKHLITINSTSSANLAAFSTLTSPKLGARAIQEGDEVVGVTAGFPTTVTLVLQFGAVPVFVDVDRMTHNIDARMIEAAIGSKTKAIMLAHSPGNTYHGQMVGNFGDIATLSFDPAHHVTMGEGGAMFTNNDAFKSIAESFRDWGLSCYCAPGKDNT